MHDPPFPRPTCGGSRDRLERPRMAPAGPRASGARRIQNLVPLTPAGRYDGGMGRLPKRYPWWLATTMAVIALAVGLILVESGRPVYRVGRVHDGMTYQEVEGLPGPPDGVQPWWSDGLPVYLWKFRGGSYVWVSMDEDGRVRSKEFRP